MMHVSQVNDVSLVTKETSEQRKSSNKHLELHCVDWNNYKMEVMNDTVLIEIITK